VRLKGCQLLGQKTTTHEEKEDTTEEEEEVVPWHRAGTRKQKKKNTHIAGLPLCARAPAAVTAARGVFRPARDDDVAGRDAGKQQRSSASFTLTLAQPCP